MNKKYFNIDSNDYSYSIAILVIESNDQAIAQFENIFECKLVSAMKVSSGNYLFQIEGHNFLYAVTEVGYDDKVKKLSKNLKVRVGYFQYEDTSCSYRNSIYKKGKIIDDWIFEDGDSIKYIGEAIGDGIDKINVNEVLERIYSHFKIFVPSLKFFPGNKKSSKVSKIYNVLNPSNLNPRVRQFMEMIKEMPDGPAKDGFQRMIDSLTKK